MKNEAARRAASAFHSLNAESGLLRGHGRDAFGVVVGVFAEVRTMSKYCDIIPPYSSLERDFCRRGLARQKGPEDDLRAETGNRRPPRARNARKNGLSASELSVAGLAPGLEPGTH